MRDVTYAFITDSVGNKLKLKEYIIIVLRFSSKIE